MSNLVLQQGIENRIFVIRNQRVMVDRDLAELYEIETKHLNRQVRRNKHRFPKEFMFTLTVKEKNELVTKCHRFQSMKYSSSLPSVFTEHGVAMLATVLNSEIAVKMSIEIIKTFIKLRKIISTHKQVAKKLKQLEGKIDKHDEDIRSLFEAIRQLTTNGQKPKKKIGFYIGE